MKKRIITIAMVLCLICIMSIGTVVSKYLETVNLPGFHVSIDGTNIPQSLVIDTAPAKTVYNHGDVFDPTDMIITVNYSDGTSATATDYIVANGSSLNSNGQTSVTISYTENGITKVVEQAVTVNKVLSKISVTTVPNKLVYAPGDTFSSAGMVITATYTDGTSAAVSGYTITNGSSLTADQKTVTISYTENGVTKSAIQAITVEEVVTVTITPPTWTDSIHFTVTGTAFCGSSDISTLTVNGNEVSVDENGNWSADITLDGLTIEAVATTESGSMGSAVITYNKLLLGSTDRSLVGYTDESSLLNIPATFQHTDGIWYKITEIYSSAFYQCSGLKSVTIPDSVTSIGSTAFYKCSELASVTIPDSVTSIGKSAFQYCTALTNITIPDGVSSIADNTFSNCSSLSSIVIPESVTSIGSSAFQNCAALTNITIPNSVTSIGRQAFIDCVGLTSVIIPEHVTNIDELVFAGCTNLMSISVDPKNSVYHSAGNCLIETSSKTLIAGCAASVIPSDGSVASIGNHAFRNIKTLASINIPDSVISIGRYAFYQCNGMRTVTFDDTEGWYVTTTEGATSGKDLVLTSTTNNATYLRSTYDDYYWYKAQ